MTDIKWVSWELASPALIRKTLKKIKAMTSRQTKLEEYHD